MEILSWGRLKGVFAPSGLFLVIFENIKKLVKSACKVFFCVVVYSKPEKWRPYKTAPKRAALDRSKKMIETNQAYSFVIDNGICTQDEADLVTSINGYNVEAINDIIYCRTGYHDIEQLHDCEPDGFDFSMIDGLEDEEDEEEGED